MEDETLAARIEDCWQVGEGIQTGEAGEVWREGTANVGTQKDTRRAEWRTGLETGRWGKDGIHSRWKKMKVDAGEGLWIEEGENAVTRWPPG